MKSSNVIISILVFVCFALYVVIELKIPCKDGDKECGANIIRLQAENDSLRQNNKLLDEKYMAFQLRADSLKEKMSGIQQTILQLKNKQHEKVNAIDSLDSNELYGFFSKFNTESTGTK